MSLLLTLLGCASGPVDAGVEWAQAIEIGTGEWEWSTLEDGADIPVIMGPQGGYHLLGSVRVAGILAGDPDDLGHPDNPTTSFSVFHEERNLTPGAVYVQGLDPVENPETGFQHEMVGRFAILGIEDDDELEGAALRFHVRVEDVEGNVLEDERTLWAYPHPNNP
ncbi:MAG: hypothetical protein VXW32_11715 [Myxococcota bacterium]|nr:hypothetical protein [Myxococcota bacterium]